MVSWKKLKCLENFVSQRYVSQNAWSKWKQCVSMGSCGRPGWNWWQKEAVSAERTGKTHKTLNIFFFFHIKEYWI